MKVYPFKARMRIVVAIISTVAKALVVRRAIQLVTEATRIK